MTDSSPYTTGTLTLPTTSPSRELQAQREICRTKATTAAASLNTLSKGTHAFRTIRCPSQSCYTSVVESIRHYTHPIPSSCHMDNRDGMRPTNEKGPRLPGGISAVSERSCVAQGFRRAALGPSLPANRDQGHPSLANLIRPCVTPSITCIPNSSAVAAPGPTACAKVPLCPPAKCRTVSASGTSASPAWWGIRVGDRLSVRDLWFARACGAWHTGPTSSIWISTRACRATKGAKMLTSGVSTVTAAIPRSRVTAPHNSSMARALRYGIRSPVMSGAKEK